MKRRRHTGEGGMPVTPQPFEQRGLDIRHRHALLHQSPQRIVAMRRVARAGSVSGDEYLVSQGVQPQCALQYTDMRFHSGKHNLPAAGYLQRVRELGMTAGGTAVGAKSVAVGCATTADPQDRYQTERRTRTHYGVAMEHLKEGRAALAIRELRAAEQLDPEDEWIQFGLAEAYRYKGLTEDTERHLLRAVLDRVDDQFHAGLWREDVLILRVEFLEDIIHEKPEYASLRAA